MADIDQAQQHPHSSQRSSNASARSSGSRSKQNPQQQLSTIEKSVTHLLVATKQLLETLTQWSRGTSTEAEVSDVYVRLGYEFNIACRAFNAIGVETSDLGPVPDLLRTILEDTLSQEASQASLDKYLPRIRDIIINLLHGLKKKQQRLRQKGGPAAGAKDGSAAPTLDTKLPRQSSVASSASIDQSLAQQMEDFPARTVSSRSAAQRTANGDPAAMPDLPPRTTSVVGDRTSPGRSVLSPQNSMIRGPGRDTTASDSGSSVSSAALQNIPVIAPYPEGDTMPTSSDMGLDEPSPNLEPPPPPPPKQNDALSALQRGGELERRASRRFSAYQIHKHLGTSMNGTGAIPPAQNSPVPNRGRDVQESLSAVRSRVGTRSRNRPPTQARSPNRTTETSNVPEPEETAAQPGLDKDLPSEPVELDNQANSPLAKTPEDKLASYPFPDASQSPERFSATINGPMDDHYMPQPDPRPIPAEVQGKETGVSDPSRRAQAQTPPPASQIASESPPQPGKELTLFLQYKSKIKKFVLPDAADLSIPRLQLAFIEKFAWSTHNNGVDLPEIYIQDPVSGVRHELEELTDIKERSVLVLNVEALDEVKRHFDDGLGGIRRMVEGIKTSVDDQQSAIQRVSDRQQETAKELASIAAAPVPPPSAPAVNGTRVVSSKDKAGQLNELQTLRRDLAVVRQTYTSFVSDINASMAVIRTKASSVKKAAVDTNAAELDPTTGRAHVNRGKKQLSDDSEKIVNCVDDLQDTVEDLRKDVVTRGVRPLPRQLEAVSKEISNATADLKKMQDFLKREKPVWTKIWEKELQVVCDDRDLLTLQEELAVDLEDDLDKAAATFALVEQATKQQNVHSPDGTSAPGGALPGQGLGAPRSTSRTLLTALESGADPQKAKDSVLGEVRALQPNHESRLEAIERAEKARLRELDSRKGGEFQRELGNFVEEGKLKKTGGIDEVERIRKLREDKARKEVLERQQQRMRERAEKEAAAAAAATGGAGPNATSGDVNAAAHKDPSSLPRNSGNAMPNGSSGGGELAVPAQYEGERESSPEPGWTDAKESIGSPASEIAQS